MSRLIGAVADRLLERVAPKGVASACVPSDPWHECRYRDLSGDGVLYACHYTCTGQASCTVIGTC